MPKAIPERIIDYPQSTKVGRTSSYSAGATPAGAVDDHTHTGTVGSGGIVSHDVLSGLTDDDHTQYLLADGTRTTQELRFDTTPTPSETLGSLAWDTDHETLNLYQGAVTLQLGQEVHFYCYNDTGSDIDDGTVVMFDADAGAHGASGHIHCTPAVADGTYPATMILGVATEDIVNGGSGKVTFFGEVHGVDTSGWTIDDILYPDPATPGALTSTAPDAPNLRYQIAVVTSVGGAGSGRIFVRAVYSTSVSGSDDVYLNGGPFDGDFLRWDNTDSRWENEVAVTRHYIPSAQTYTIPQYHNLLIAHEDLTVLGDLHITGDVIVIDPLGETIRDTITTTATNYNVTLLDDYVVVTTDADTVTITLPAVATALHAVEIIRTDATIAPVTVVDAGGALINGETSQTLRQWDAMKCVPVGTFWVIG